MGQNHVSFGKLGNMSFDNFKGIRREHLNNANSSLDEGIFNKYDTNKDNVLDKGELEELKNDLLEYAGGNGQIGRREAKNFIKDKLGVNANYNREDLEAILSEIASGEDDVEFAETKGGVTTIRFRENAGVTTTQKHTVINEQVQLLEQTEEHADFKTVTKWNENGSSTVVKTYTDTSQPTETWEFSNNNTLTEYFQNKGTVTTYFDVSTGAQDLSKPTKIITDKGSGVSETTLITYNTDGTRTETTTSTANPNESTVVVRNADGTERSRTTVTSDARTETSNGIRTITDANGRVTSQVPVDAEGKPISYTHEVQPGDTWYGIVQAKYGITDHATTMAVIRKLKSENNVDPTSTNIPKNITLLPTIDLGNKTVNLKNIQASVNPIHNSQNSRLTPLSSAERSITIDSKFNTSISNASSSTGAIAETGGSGYYTVDDNGRINAYYPTWSAYQAKDEQIWITRDTDGKISTYTVNTYDASGNPTGGIEYNGQGKFSRRWVNVGFSADNNGQNDGWTHKVFYDADGNYIKSYTKAQWEQGENV